MNARCQISVQAEVLHGFAPDDYARHKPPPHRRRGIFAASAHGR